jgi:hypothetical protein
MMLIPSWAGDSARSRDSSSPERKILRALNIIRKRERHHREKPEISVRKVLILLKKAG